MAAANAGGRGGLGWVILVAALAVPGVLFYNWWSHLKIEREKAVAAKARGRVPEGGVFQASPNPTKLVNPMTPVAPAVSTSAAVEVSSAPAPEPAAAPPAPAAAPAPAAPALARDPMLSPFDLLRIKEEEDNRRLAQERLAEERSRNGRRPARREPAPETQIQLQGIISNSEGGSKAIVNNEVVGVGDMIGKIRVLRITAAGVTFEYKGRRFTRSVSRE